MPETTLPPDDEGRRLSVADPEDPGLLHLAVVGDTYTVLLTGEDTAGKLGAIDMLVPPGGGPPTHRHDFEELFHVLEGEVEVTFRGVPATARTGHTVNIPANAPHSFRNVSDAPARLLCIVAPAGLEEYFAQFAEPVATRTTPAPEVDEAVMAERMGRAMALAAQYRVETL